MPVVRVQTLLPAGFTEPNLELLRPTENGYRALLMQPAGPIFASDARIGHRDTAHASHQARKFLELSQARGAHFAVIPEYFTPWPVLQAAIGDGLLPAHDALWVVGCESTTFEELIALRAAMADQCLILFEPPCACRTRASRRRRSPVSCDRHRWLSAACDGGSVQNRSFARSTLSRNAPPTSWIEHLQIQGSV